MRRYEKEVPSGKTNRHSFKVLNKGLKKVNIGEDVWLFGRQKYVKNPDGSGSEINHMVIYGPERKEYHVYGKEVHSLCGFHRGYYDEEIPGSYCNRDGNIAIESLVKIYILTSILDEKENWCFDLTIPPVADVVKVIYDNGTVKNIKDFNLEFIPTEISKKYESSFGYRESYSAKTINPIGYRLPGIESGPYIK